MTEAEKKALLDEVGVQMKAAVSEQKAKIEDLTKAIDAQKGFATKEQFDELALLQKSIEEKFEDILRKQGLSLAELQGQINTVNSIKTIAEVFEENKEAIADSVQGKSNTQFMVGYNSKGQIVARAFDPRKAAGVTGTIDGLSGVGSLSSVVGSLPAAVAMRQAHNAPVVDSFSNSAWLLNLVNTTSVGFDPSNSTIRYWIELPKEGAATVVAEGAKKPLVQYRYELKSAEYKKVAQRINMTEEFRLDFPALEDQMLGKGREDLVKQLDTIILTDVIANATAYNTAAAFGTVPFANNYDVVNAMAAQVEAVTFGNRANVALLNTYTNRNTASQKTAMGTPIVKPSTIQNIEFISNPALTQQQVVVGDLKEYNLTLRGPMIVRFGLNGEDFSENKVTAIMEQFYFNYISPTRTNAIVKGAFDTIKAAINEA